MESRILVSILGAHEIVTAGVRSLLATADDLEVLDGPPPHGSIPDVILYDAIGAEADAGAELYALIQDSASAVLVMGRDLRPDLAARAMVHGAAGWFSMESDRDAVLRMIRDAATGELEAESTQRHADVLGGEAGLSRREVQVLGHITRGLSNEEIGHALGLSANTIKSHIRNAYRRLGVNSRSQAVAWCLMHGFEPPPDARRGSTLTVDVVRVAPNDGGRAPREPH